MLSAVLAEFIGTFIFLSSIIHTFNPYIIGATFTMMVLLFVNISGSNFNPAVSAMLAYAGKLKMNLLAPYILAQLSGGFMALWVLRHTKSRT
jgi:glycerol uptake facilitator-like aquaporin